MNFENVVKVLSWAIANRHELASDAECAIHVIRRIEHSCVHHKTNVDALLVAAEKTLADYNKPKPDPVNDALREPKPLHRDDEKLKLNQRLSSSSTD